MPEMSTSLGVDFNPRPPRGGRRRGFALICRAGDLFQSTPSARRATVVLYPPFLQVVNFNPRPPRGGRPGNNVPAMQASKISIHALREEGDLFQPLCEITGSILFQSTPSARRATGCRCLSASLTTKFQSTPSARRATFNFETDTIYTEHFNPRPPRGGRPARLNVRCVYYIFQSTPSARRATRSQSVP